eukprot:1704639-Amphidinium_carterae.2
MVAELWLTIGETIIEDNNLHNEDEIEENNTVTLRAHMIDDNTIGMMELPTPTQFDCKNPQF